ncbi:hypothetical protein ADL12_05155 [Streptomyces regalis]|uniref:Uncharacterized protein n=1 Tax=Streptomyces regalis TaxID=68262 RepID=A0A0X3VJM3_9ACTN|nr:hypothetical protein ADL12_05155 [Streptomyces regalis]
MSSTTPSVTRKSASLARLPVENGRPCSAITSRTRSELVHVTVAVLSTGMPCAESSTVWARRQVTTEPVPRRMIRKLPRPGGSR